MYYTLRIICLFTQKFKCCHSITFHIICFCSAYIILVQLRDSDCMPYDILLCILSCVRLAGIILLYPVPCLHLVFTNCAVTVINTITK